MWTGRQRRYEVHALRLLGEIAARHNPPEHAEGHYRDALALADELGMRPLVAHCHLGLGKLYRRTGKREQVQEHPNRFVVGSDQFFGADKERLVRAREFVDALPPDLAPLVGRDKALRLYQLPVRTP